MTFNLAEAQLVLNRTPLILKTLLAGLHEDWIYSNEGPDTWSPFDIVGHLIHGEKTDWIPRAKIILSKADNKTFESFDRFAQFEASKGKSLANLIEEFTLLRAHNLVELEQLDLDASTLEKTGIHPELGLASLKELLATWVVHDLNHLNQMTRVLAKNYKEEIGPWKAYMTVVKS